MLLLQTEIYCCYYYCYSTLLQLQLFITFNVAVVLLEILILLASLLNVFLNRLYRKLEENYGEDDCKLTLFIMKSNDGDLILGDLTKKDTG